MLTPQFNHPVSPREIPIMKTRQSYLYHMGIPTPADIFINPNFRTFPNSRTISVYIDVNFISLWYTRGQNVLSKNLTKKKPSPEMTKYQDRALEFNTLTCCRCCFCTWHGELQQDSTAWKIQKPRLWQDTTHYPVTPLCSLAPEKCVCNLKLIISPIIWRTDTLRISCEIALRWMPRDLINSLARGKCGCNLKLVIFKLIPRIVILSIFCEITLR